jgi:NADH-quinone oxidoreductase subunit N
LYRRREKIAVELHELHNLVNASIADTKASLWPAFAPEVVLCGTIFLLLIVRLFKWGRRIDVSFLAMAGSLVALYFAYPWTHLTASEGVTRVELFTGMLVYDAFSVYVRGFLMLFAVLFVIFTRVSGVPDRNDACDFYCLFLGATLGMCLMASANHLLMVFMAVEMASVPSYALAAMQKGRPRASEAALKYSVYGAGAAGIMLYGISLVAGVLGSAHIPTLATELSQRLPELIADQRMTVMVLALGALMIMVGLAFKLSAVPFHFWCPDVFEGASAEVNAFLSVASKAAALALLVRITIGFGVVTESIGVAEVASATHTHATTVEVSIVDTRDNVVSTGPVMDVALLGRESEHASTTDTLGQVRQYLALLIAILAAITCTFGNLAAYGQTNIKRLMAYSTIAHAGYMMLPIPAALALAGDYDVAAEKAISSLALYIAVYLFMNLGAFAIVAFLRNSLRTEEIDDYAGLVRTSPGIVVCFAVILFSLVGLPPLAGFVGKFAIFASLTDGYQLTGYTYLLLLLFVGGINTAISLFYYLRVVKVMTIDPPGEVTTVRSFSMISLPGAYIGLVTLPLLLLFVKWEALNKLTVSAARHLF